MVRWKEKCDCLTCAVLVAVLAALLRSQGEVRRPGDDATVGPFYTNSAEHPSAWGLQEAEHVWPTARGHVGSYSWANSTAPFELTEKTLRWKWSHLDGRFFTLTYGTVLDADLNIYLSAADGLRKFSPQGDILWEYRSLPSRLMDSPVVHRGGVYFTTTAGVVMALNAVTGHAFWVSKVARESSEDNGFATAHDGVVVTSTDSTWFTFSKQVVALSAASGDLLWSYRPDMPVWNFMASFAGDGTLVFQDMTGKAYRLNASTGALLWKAGGNPDSWTDGTLALGSNGVAYAVACRFGPAGGGAHAPGDLRAHRLSDGQVLWQVVTPRVPNVAPAVGRLYGKQGLSVVQALGQQVLKGAPTDVFAYDAETGKLQWTFDGPRQKGDYQAGDAEGYAIRNAVVGRGMCLPNPWSAPTIDASGTVYIGNQDGVFFALRDTNGDGRVEGPDEVSAFDTQGSFSGSAGPSIAPGMVVATSCDSMYVFRD